MITSIRKFLLINLLLSVAATIALTAIGNLLLDNKEIQRQLDIELIQEALTFQALAGNNPQKIDFKTLQKRINTVPNSARQFFRKLHGAKHEQLVNSQAEFQIWNEQGKMLMHSANAPEAPLSDGAVGFSTRTVAKRPWRVFTTNDPKSGLTTVVAERYEIRDELGKALGKNDLVILLITYPLLGLLIWVIIGRGLNSLRRVANEVSHREPSYLEPVDLKAVPEEISPLVDELNKLFLRLQQAIEREKRFSADAAHELRTPLAALRTQVQVALMTAEEEERKAALEKVIKSVDRSTHVVQQLLTLSRLNPEATIESPKEISLPSLATEIIADLVPSALEKAIEIELIAPEQNIKIAGDQTAIDILIRNLVDNAIRYIPEGSKIGVYILRTYNKAIVRVSDNGPGIPAALRARVFERFFRVLGNKSPGSGLGLAIVQQIAGLHGAKVKLGTPPSGKGLEVEVSFPIFRG